MKLVAGAEFHQSAVFVKNRNNMDPAIQQLQYVFARRLGARTHEIAVHERRDLHGQVVPRQELATYIAVRQTADNAR